MRVDSSPPKTSSSKCDCSRTRTAMSCAFSQPLFESHRPHGPPPKALLGTLACKLSPKFILHGRSTWLKIARSCRRNPIKWLHSLVTTGKFFVLQLNEILKASMTWSQQATF
uniref:Uncharacterized protein n=1 Tax=Physcomitrium patens TaxID=3218 RepID=A0A2K1IR34_PHYPA|nr:hypothetical protein PHYPA_025851 [Physcomitrium patens]